MSFDIDPELKQALNKDEKLLWSGRPKAGVVLRATDIYTIPFTLLWFAFAIFWEYNVLKMGISIFALFGVPFLIAGLYMVVGRFFIDAWKRKNTVYGITANRIIIKSGLLNKDIESINIRTLANLTFKEKPDGSGTITLGPPNVRYAMFNGISSWPGMQLPQALN